MTIDDLYIPPADIAGWHPKLRSLYETWRRQAPAPDRLPGRQHVGPEVLKAWLPVIWLLDIVWDEIDAQTGLPRIRYRLAGTKLVDMRGGHNPVGMWFEESNPSRASPNPTVLRIHAMLQSRQPSWRRGAPNNQRIGAVRMVENLFLPLAADGNRVDMILGGSLYFGLEGNEI